MTTEQPKPAPGSTDSVAQLVGTEWVLTNTDDATLTHHAESLTDALMAHRHAVAFKTGKDLTVRYLLGTDDIADRITRIRAAGEQVAMLRRQASHAEAAIRPDRTALMRELAALHVTPEEIAQIVGVPTTAVPKDLGTDHDARLARALAARGVPTEHPSDNGRLF